MKRLSLRLVICGLQNSSVPDPINLTLRRTIGCAPGDITPDGSRLPCPGNRVVTEVEVEYVLMDRK